MENRPVSEAINGYRIIIVAPDEEPVVARRAQTAFCFQRGVGSSGVRTHPWADPVPVLPREVLP
jgi:hypothetical protein